MRRLVLVLLGGVVSCSSDSIFGVEAPGENARVTWHTTESAGGQIYESAMAVDSATGRYELHRCQGTVSSPCATTEERSGNVPPPVLLQLFQRAQSREFRDLKAEYSLNGDVIPPDGGWTQLMIVVGERRKSVGWDKHVSIPQILRDYGCLMLAATESLLCD